MDRNFWVKFPTMHQKGNNNRNEGTVLKYISKLDMNNDRIPNQDRQSNKDYNAPKKNRENYNRKKYEDKYIIKQIIKLSRLFCTLTLKIILQKR